MNKLPSDSTALPAAASAITPNPTPGLAGLVQSALAGAFAGQSQNESKFKRGIRLLLADDHPVVRKGIASCLAGYDHLQIIGEAADGLEALRKARELTPDIILMDIDMPHMNGLEVTELLRKEMPVSKVLILSMHGNTEYVTRIIQSGASGYVRKDVAAEELVRAIETVNAGEAFFSPGAARGALNKRVHTSGESSVGQLTEREREVLVQIAEGLSNKQIASNLEIRVRTVESHREHIIRKLNIHSVAGLTKFAISKGLISLNG